MNAPIEIENRNLKEDKNKLLAKLQDIEAQNLLQKNNNLLAENKELKNKETQSMKKINDLESLQKELMAKIKDLRDKDNSKAKVGILFFIETYSICKVRHVKMLTLCYFRSSSMRITILSTTKLPSLRASDRMRVLWLKPVRRQVQFALLQNFSKMQKVLRF